MLWKHLKPNLGDLSADQPTISRFAPSNQSAPAKKPRQLLVNWETLWCRCRSIRPEKAILSFLPPLVEFLGDFPKWESKVRHVVKCMIEKPFDADFTFWDIHMYECKTENYKLNLNTLMKVFKMFFFLSRIKQKNLLLCLCWEDGANAAYSCWRLS